MQGSRRLRVKGNFGCGRLWRNIGYYAGYDDVKGAYSTAHFTIQPTHPRGNFVWVMLGGNFPFTPKDDCRTFNGTAEIRQFFERYCTCFGGNAFIIGCRHV